MIKRTLWIGASLCWFSFTVNAGELLGHISEDTAQPMSDVKPSQSEDRRIIYRVICSPGDEQLPDCEQPVVDSETVVPSKAIESDDNAPEMAQDQELGKSAPEPQQIAKAGKAKPKANNKKTTGKTKVAKKTKTTKKADSKKTATKKPASKKKKH